jgi:hypothetical protein
LDRRKLGILAYNATFELVVTPDSAVLMDPGGSWLGARMPRTGIRSVTEFPVVYIIDMVRPDHPDRGALGDRHGTSSECLSSDFLAMSESRFASGLF